MAVHARLRVSLEYDDDDEEVAYFGDGGAEEEAGGEEEYEGVLVAEAERASWVWRFMRIG